MADLERSWEDEHAPSGTVVVVVAGMWYALGLAEIEL